MSYTAVITGASKGIGLDLAQRLLAKGYTVISIARNATEEFEHPEFETVKADLLDPAAVEAAARDIAARHQVTHFIHNAGMIWPNPVEDASPDDLAGLTQLHLGSALTLLQTFLPAMKDRRFGRVLFNGSRAALGVPTRTAYSATKAGQVGMARTWALELAPHGITVNVVAPGPVQTDNFWASSPRGRSARASWPKTCRWAASAPRAIFPTLSCFSATRRMALSPGRPCMSAAGPACRRPPIKKAIKNASSGR